MWVAFTVARLEQVQAIAAGPHAGAERVDAWQQAGKVEARGAELAQVERLRCRMGQAHHSHARPQVGVEGVAKHLKVLHRRRAKLARVALATVEQPSAQFVDVVHGSQQWRSELGVLHRQRLGKGDHFVRHAKVSLATITQQLAPDQVEGLDAVGTFVDLGDAAVTYQLLLAPLTDIAVATQYLLAVHGGLQPHVGEEGLGHRCKPRHLGFGLGAGSRVIAVLGQVQLQRHVG